MDDLVAKYPDQFLFIWASFADDHRDIGVSQIQEFTVGDSKMLNANVRCRQFRLDVPDRITLVWIKMTEYSRQ